MINNESSPGNSPIDLPSALARIGNDESFLHELLNLYKMDFEAKIEGLQKAIDLKNFVSIQELGHSLKGASANLSLPFLQKAALDMECAGRDKNLDKARGALITLGQEFQSLQEFLSTRG
ncbi:MAG: Hpt domain-containing protein [Candidatus Aminicenantes bacterium]|jgi:HPt (histidine-containing phosphotransfer) domain-containing protein